MVQVLTRFGLFVGILIFINILSSFVHTQLDLTEEKRFTLTQPTRTMLQSLDNQIYVNVLLEGEFPAGFKRLQDATRAILEDFRSESGLIDYAFEDPSEGTTEEINARRKILSEDGINPVNLRVMDQGETTQKLIYPYATVHLGQRREVIKLLENETPSLNSEEVLNNSVGLLEYKFANALKRLGSESKPMIFFTFGHGELHPLQTAELRKALQPSFDVLDMNLDSLVSIDPKACQLLIVAKPRGPFSEKDKFKIDQYIMQGGKVLWLVDRLNAELDSLAQAGTFLPTDYPLGIEDMLFKYGVRIQPDLVLDLQCSKIPLRVGQMGNAPQLDLFDWYYNVAASPAGSHPICKNLDWTELRFCSSIDTLRTKTPIIILPY